MELASFQFPRMESSVSAKSRGGLTLIEIMIGVLIISVLASLAVPAFLNWNENERVKAAARAASDAFLLARSEAIRTGNNHFVVFGKGLAGATEPIVVVNDGPAASANCVIDAGEIVHAVRAERDVSWGTSPGGANGTVVPTDTGASAATAVDGWTFTDAEAAPGPASWVLFQADGLPRTFSPGANCTKIGNAGDGGGAIYLTNGERDYAAVLLPLGTSRVHRWQAGGSWSN